MREKLKILVADDDRFMRTYISDMIAERGYKVHTSPDGLAALEKLKASAYDVLITDLQMPGMGGLGLLSEVKEKYSRTFVIILTGRGTVETAVQSIKKGAYDYIEKPIENEKLLTLIERIAEYKDRTRVEDLVDNDSRKDYRFENIVGNSPLLLKIFDEIREIAKTDVSVLITGENGTGKELIANAIHYGRSRATPCVKINCGALAENVVESELFGHEKGAFTGATSQKKGKIEMAHGGTLFLDELGELTLSTQVKLLRVLERGEFQRVGGLDTLVSKFRLISATNRDLTEAVLNKTFREDLYYRVNTVTLCLPPLRDRKADIPLLVDYFLNRFCARLKKKERPFSAGAMDTLMQYDWPGNVRELSHVVERALIYSKGPAITADNLPEIITRASRERGFTVTAPSKSLADIESTHIYNVLEENRWNLNRAARQLKIARGTLYSKMEKYHILKPRQKTAGN